MRYTPSCWRRTLWGLMSEQSARAVLMVEPTHFFSNLDTSADNSFQSASTAKKLGELQSRALTEFCALRAALESAGVEVKVFKNISPETPDSIYPNNWFSTQPGKLVLYPMRAEVRRRERREDIIAWLKTRYASVVDFSEHERRGQFLEGTGSLVLDRVYKIAYVSLSLRSDEKLAQKWAQEMGYRLVTFHAQDLKGKPIYHTNVLMTIGSGYCLVCLELITERAEREMVRNSLIGSGLQIIELSPAQVGEFCANALEVQGSAKYLVLSDRSRRVLTAAQLEALSHRVKLLSVELPSIETYGGGGARCMLAELF